ncbi:hypothetical protein QQZ08_012433 [Neonectria magnoliae]|uniref:Uncharacterized protein n=1 Tax=Neonectria magnoliae TaxID=2732573 RepID=A0ABR1H3E3_9HYPO
MDTRVRVLYQGLGLPPTTVEFAFLQPGSEYTETQLLLFHYFITKLEAKLRVNIVLESDLTEEPLNMRLDALEAKYSTKDARPSAQVRQLRFSPGLLRSPTTKEGDSDQSDSAASSEEEGEEGDDEWENITAP